MSEYEPYQQRVVEEMVILEERISKLKSFLDGGMFPSLSYSERVLLSNQYYVMGCYLSILQLRIEGFNQK